MGDAPVLIQTVRSHRSNFLYNSVTQGITAQNINLANFGPSSVPYTETIIIRRIHKKKTVESYYAPGMSGPATMNSSMPMPHLHSNIRMKMVMELI